MMNVAFRFPIQYGVFFVISLICFGEISYGQSGTTDSTKFILTRKISVENSRTSTSYKSAQEYEVTDGSSIRLADASVTNRFNRDIVVQDGFTLYTRFSVSGNVPFNGSSLIRINSKGVEEEVAQTHMIEGSCDSDECFLFGNILQASYGNDGVYRINYDPKLVNYVSRSNGGSASVIPGSYIWRVSRENGTHVEYRFKVE